VGERVLVLDDEASILDLLGQLLSEVNYDCTMTTSALEALKLLEEGDFALLMTDLKMPEMHGIEVVQRAKKLDPDLAVIVVTALLDVTNAIEALRGGADDYLLKPFNLSEICLSVEKALDRRRLVIENRRHQQELEKRVAEATASIEAANQELSTTKDYLESLINSTVDAILTVSPEGAVSFVNEGALRMFDYPREAILGLRTDDLFAGGAEEARYVRRLLSEEGVLQNYETEFRAHQGHTVPVNVTMSLVKGPDGSLMSHLAICKDITRQKKLERELKEMSIKDSLSGLYNQRYFYDRLESEIYRAERQSRPLSLLLFDIDQFKSYNDCHGHLEGDKVLQAAGALVEECTREHVDIGFRYGGDEFTVILPDANEEQARHIADRIRATFESRQFDRLTLSMGLATYTKGTSLLSFIRSADVMMYDAKRAGGNRVYVHSSAAVPHEERLDVPHRRIQP